MTRTAAAPARDRLLDAAEELFCAHGTQGVGIDTILERAGVAKMTLYHHFGSKEDLIRAWLERRHEAWKAWLKSEVERRAPKPAARLGAFFDVVEEWCSGKRFCGCPFVNTALEVREAKHGSKSVCDRHFAFIGEYIRDLVAMTGHPSPEKVAGPATVLTMGAIVSAALSGEAGAVRVAKQAAGVLLGAGGSGVKI